MKYLIAFVVFALLLTLPKTLAAKNKKKSTGGNLKTEMSFDEAQVRGRYNFAGEGNAIVEDEKLVTDLLGVRTHFKDRLVKQAGPKGRVKVRIKQ